MEKLVPKGPMDFPQLRFSMSYEQIEKNIRVSTDEQAYLLSV